jgi:predicted dehydrogenase
MKKLNIAVVGCGYWGPNLIRNFIASQDCNVVKICDLDIDRLNHIKELYPCLRYTTNFEEIIESDEIDAVVIATPVRTHHAPAKQCLLAGKHTFVEKPLASSTGECEDLIETANRKGLTLMVGHTFIYSPPVRKMKEIILSGEIGDILYISARRLNLGLFQKDINTAWDLATHDISIILYLLEKFPSSVSCQGKAHITLGIEDVTNICLNFNDTNFAMIQSSWLDPKKVREITLVGSKKMVWFDDTEPLEKIKIYDKHVKIPPHYDTFAEFQYAYHYGDMYAPYLKQTEPLRIETQHFIDCIKNGRKSDSCGEEGLQVVRILEAANESLRSKREVISIS